MKQSLSDTPLGVDVKPDYWLTQKMLSAFLDISERTLERMRSDGSGPRFSKAGKRVLYRASDVNSWLAARSFASTAEAKLVGML